MREFLTVLGAMIDRIQDHRPTALAGSRIILHGDLDLSHAFHVSTNLWSTVKRMRALMSRLIGDQTSLAETCRQHALYNE